MIWKIQNLDSRKVVYIEKNIITNYYNCFNGVFDSLHKQK